MKLNFYRLTQKESCPYCGGKCIPFHKIASAGSVWCSPTCPKCGATLQLDKKLVVLKNIGVAIMAFIFIIITINSDVILPRGWGMLTLLIAGMLEGLIALISDLDYEENWKYPKPKKTQK